MNQETTRKLSKMNSRGFIDGYHEQEQSQEYMDLTFEERFQLLVDGEYARRQSNKLLRLMKAAKFHSPSATLDDIEYHPDRKLDKQLMIELQTGNYIREPHNVILMGASGNGKTLISNALGTQACR